MGLFRSGAGRRCRDMLLLPYCKSGPTSGAINAWVGCRPGWRRRAGSGTTAERALTFVNNRGTAEGRGASTSMPLIGRAMLMAMDLDPIDWK